MKINEIFEGPGLSSAARQILRIMKLTTLIMTIFLLQVSAASVAQITLNTKQESLRQVLKNISRQSGYDFIFASQDLNGLQVSNIKLNNVSIEKALQECLAGQPVDFEIADRTVMIKRKGEKGIIDKIKEFFTNIDVTGKIVDEKGMPLAGASVMVKGTALATVSGADGTFLLRGVADDAVIVVSYIGYQPKDIKAVKDMGTVVLQIMNSQLDQVQVIAYGTTTRRLATGSISSVSAAEIEKQPISNPILALAGRTPGLFITQSAGYAGAPFSATIRGQTSFGLSSSTPLYVVDGVPFGDGPVERSSGSFGITLGLSPLNNISMDEIESINVLKDADATAIYGSRGANGVILITTKKGKSGKTKLSVDVNSGFGDVTNTIKMLGTEQYLSIRKQAFANDGVIPTVANAPDLKLWDQNGYTNYPDLLMGNTSHQTKAAFTVSGGDVHTQFLFGGNYRRESTVLKASTADEAVQFHTNMQHSSLDNKFGINLSASYNMDNNTMPNYSITSSNYSLPPNYPVYNSDGSLYWGGGYTNPLADFNKISTLKSTNFVSNLSLKYLILPGLTVKADLGYNYNNIFGSVISPASAFNPATAITQTSNLMNNYIKTYIAEPQLNYTHTWGKGKLSALVGGSWQQTQSVQPYYILGIFTTTQLATSLAALTVLSKASGYQDYKYDSGFGRLEYDWDGKYLFSANIRRDGSSKFGSEKAFGTFGSAAAAWIFSKEQFVKDSFSWLSFGKLRASYGSIGSDKSLQNYATLSNYNAGTGYGPGTTLSPANLLNPYLQWEVTKKLDIALELGFLNDRIFLSGNYYRNRTNNLLGLTPLPNQTGFDSYSANLPATVQNKGFELELSTTNIKNNNLTWRTSFNFSLPKNKLVSFPGLATSTYANTYVVGQPLNMQTGFHSTGIVNGIATAQDINGDGQLTSGLNGDFIVIGTPDPKYYGGLSNTVSYKGFQLDFLFQFVKRTAARGDLNFASPPGNASNLPASFLDVPLKYTSTFGTPASNAYFYYTGSDAAIEDASFIRLKNVSLAYNFPAAWAKKLKMSSLQVYGHGQNLLTITKYKGLDPETLTNLLPPLRMLVFGTKFTF